jgi:hypothetical protein
MSRGLNQHEKDLHGPIAQANRLTVAQELGLLGEQLERPK